MDYNIFIVTFVFLILIFLAYIVGRFVERKRFESKIPSIREDAIKKSRAVLGGQFSEQLAPFMPDFPYSPTEARFIGKPIDFIVFKGMDEKEIYEVAFVEVKSGKSSLNSSERSLRHAIENKKVVWSEYRVPEGITKKRYPDS